MPRNFPDLFHLPALWISLIKEITSLKTFPLQYPCVEYLLSNETEIRRSLINTFYLFLR